MRCKVFIFLAFLIQITAAQQPVREDAYSLTRKRIVENDIKTYGADEKIPFDTIAQMHFDKYFLDAYNEMSSMLDKESYNLKRAEFLVEWAYNSGRLDYASFSDTIANAVKNLKRYIQVMNIQHYKTAVNAALFYYFTRPSWVNGYLPFSYDVEDCSGEKDISKLFVSKVMKKHSGQCTSLPVYYKILCNELGGKAYLATAPGHMYIKHISEDGKWVNVELTTGSFARDEWYIQSMGVSTEAIKNGLFLTAMSDKEDVAYMLYMLGVAYMRKYGDYDYFTLMCANRILAELPRNYFAMILTIGTRQQWGYDYVKRFGKTPSSFIIHNYGEFRHAKNLLDSLGYTTITKEEYVEKVRQGYKDLGKDLPSSWMEFEKSAK